MKISLSATAENRGQGHKEILNAPLVVYLYQYPLIFFTGPFWLCSSLIIVAMIRSMIMYILELRFFFGAPPSLNMYKYVPDLPSQEFAEKVSNSKRA